VANSPDFEKIKQNLVRKADSGKKRLSHLYDLASREGWHGIGHWFKSQNEIEQLSGAIDELIIASEDEDFTLLQVDSVLNSFKLLDEDKSQAEWYKTAHCLIEEFQQRLVENKLFDLKKLQAVCKELKFISEATEFHERYRLQPIQEKVIAMYKDLEQHINDYKSLEKQRIELKNNQDKIKQAELEKSKAQAEAKKAMLESVKIKEKRLAIIEEKKKKMADKELLEAQQANELKMAEIESKRSEQARQEKLQEAYIDLQLEEKIMQWDAKDVAEILTKKLADSSLDDSKKQSLKLLLDSL
jgi:hypothetical protein